MHIEPGEKQGTVDVRFDSYRERYRYGAEQPRLSPEGFRWVNRVTHGLASFGLMEPYSHDDEDYPQVVNLSDTSLGRAACGLADTMNVANTSVATLAREMIGAIGSYFTRLAEQQ